VKTNESQYKQWAMGGAGHSELSGKARNTLVCFQKRLRPADYILVLFFTVDVVGWFSRLS
jgi:hypothetical protein